MRNLETPGKTGRVEGSESLDKIHGIVLAFFCTEKKIF